MKRNLQKKKKIEKEDFLNGITLSRSTHNASAEILNDYHTHSKLQHFSYKQKVALLIRNQDAKA